MSRGGVSVPIERHNWVHDSPRNNGVKCTSDNFIRADATCRGCGASIPSDTVVEADDNIGIENSDESRRRLKIALDELWHTKLRPMAALCSLVEETDDSPA